MRIIAIDPGTIKSGVVHLDSKLMSVYSSVCDNDDILEAIYSQACTNSSWSVVVVEMVACYGMPVGKETFETCVWIGRFLEAAEQTLHTSRLYRRDIKLHLCGTAKAKDANIWQVILDRYGGKEAAIGNKKQPGPLYGVKSHARAALAVALTWHDGIRSEGL
jgi:hypothetical protein